MRHLYWGSTALALAGILILAGCGGNSSGSSTSSNTGNVQVVASDDANDDWSVIGVQILSVSLTPQNGGGPVTVYTAPSPAPVTNLVELDQLGDLLANAPVPPGIYTGATLTIAANPGDVILTVSPDPSIGFPGSPGANIPSSQIQVAGASGGTVPVNVNFVSPISVSVGHTLPIDFEFDLNHPLFLVYDGANSTWTVNFNGPCRHHPFPDFRRLILRHIYGNVNSVSSDDSSITITRDFPAFPPTSPETAIASSQTLTIEADSTRGTIFYDLDAGTRSVIENFSSVAGTLPGRYIRVAARYQQDGTLVAVRIWASNNFNTVWVSPEGHVLHVDPVGDTLTVLNEVGQQVTMNINGSTVFYFRQPWNPSGEAMPIGQGGGFLSQCSEVGSNLCIVRGFKVHITPVSVSSTVAAEVDIEIAKFSGFITNANTTNFTYTHPYRTAGDDYSVTVPYINNDTPNGYDNNGNPVSGFDWWYFTFPTLADTFSSCPSGIYACSGNPIEDFVTAVNGAVNFGGSVGDQNVWGVSYATWMDPNNPTGWAEMFTVVEPTPVPLGTVTTPYTNIANGVTFGMSVIGGANPASVNVSTANQAATLVYQVDFSNGVVTVTPQNIQGGLTPGVMSALSTDGTIVKVLGVPQSSGSNSDLAAYVLFYFTQNGQPGARARHTRSR